MNCNRYPCDDRLIDCTEIDCCIRSVVYSYFVLLSRLILCEKARGNGMPREFAKAGSVAHSIFCVPRVWYSSHCRVLVLVVLLVLASGSWHFVGSKFQNFVPIRPGVLFYEWTNKKPSSGNPPNFKLLYYSCDTSYTTIMSHFRKSPAKATSRLGNLRNAYYYVRVGTYSTVAQYCLSVCLSYVDLIFVTQIKRPPHSGLTIPWRKNK